MTALQRAERRVIQAAMGWRRDTLDAMFNGFSADKRPTTCRIWRSTKALHLARARAQAKKKARTR